jgi:predicted RNase H-like HicB family nuclease
MAEYALYLESGPMRRKTMVHVLDLLGCMANGPTTEAALAATPEAISTYLRFLKRNGEDVEPDHSITTRIAEHITEGEWLGNGSPYVIFEPDLVPVTGEEIETLLNRFHGLRAELIAWAEKQAGIDLDARPKEGRTARSILLHVAAPTGGYLSAAMGPVHGFSRVYAAAERGDISPAEALRELERIAAERVRATTPEERAAIVRRPKEIRTLRKALRRVLEHDWEHLRELSRRAGGPRL